MKQLIRIIGGRHRGKKLQFPSESSLRPTASRIRETLFNWLMHDIHGARCLDAFAGSGALGFEAWSRGAVHVTFIEQSHQALLNIKKQAHAFDKTTLQAIEDSALRYLNRADSIFDVIFLDPPFDKPDLLAKSIQIIEQSSVLMPSGLMYTESAHPVELNPIHWDTLKAKKTGLVYYALHQKREA